MLRIAICWRAFARAAFENTGSAKAIIGLRAAEVCEEPRNIFRLATEGRTVTAWLRTSQSTSLSCLPLGSLITSSGGGRLVKAPLLMTESRVLAAIWSANAPNVA